MPNLKARTLRRNSTDAERKLWAALRSWQFSGYKFRRQHPIEQYIVDFACTKYHLIVEADGGQHAENKRDILRTKQLEEQGWKVLRFWNTDILKNTEGVLMAIHTALKRSK